MLVFHSPLGYVFLPFSSPDRRGVAFLTLSSDAEFYAESTETCVTFSFANALARNGNQIFTGIWMQRVLKQGNIKLLVFLASVTRSQTFNVANFKNVFAKIKQER